MKPAVRWCRLSPRIGGGLEVLRLDDAEPGSGTVLAQHREAIDRKRIVTHRAGECILEKGMHRTLTFWRDPPRQRHMEAELVPHVGVAETIEIRDLLRVQ